MLHTIYDTLRQTTSPRVRRHVKNLPGFHLVASRSFDTDLYSKPYYNDVERLEQASIQTIADWIVTYLKPTSCIDVGCGPAHLSKQLTSLGIDVLGVDISKQACALAAKK